MSAYLNNYVVSVICNNKPLREYSEDGARTVCIPFDSEYKIRLKNKNKERIMAKVYIDGMETATSNGGIILNPGQSLDLERFIDDLRSGKKFKFTSLEKAIEKNLITDPDNLENGKIKVEFYKEIYRKTPWFIPTSIRHEDLFPPQTGGITWTSGGTATTTVCGNNFKTVVDLSGVNLNSVNCSTSGVTVEGGESLQQFCETYFTPSDYPETIIEIKMRGPQKKNKEPQKDSSLSRTEQWEVFQKLLPVYLNLFNLNNLELPKMVPSSKLVEMEEHQESQQEEIKLLKKLLEKYKDKV